MSYRPTFFCFSNFSLDLETFRLDLERSSWVDLGASDLISKDVYGQRGVAHQSTTVLCQEIPDTCILSSRNAYLAFLVYAYKLC